MQSGKRVIGRNHDPFPYTCDLLLTTLTRLPDTRSWSNGRSHVCRVGYIASTLASLRIVIRDRYDLVELVSREATHRINRADQSIWTYDYLQLGLRCAGEAAFWVELLPHCCGPNWCKRAPPGNYCHESVHNAVENMRTCVGLTAIQCLNAPSSVPDILGSQLADEICAEVEVRLDSRSREPGTNSVSLPRPRDSRR